jgi:hypothetical protein
MKIRTVARFATMTSWLQESFRSAHSKSVSLGQKTPVERLECGEVVFFYR